MSEDTHQRSWSHGDQEILPYMFAYDYDPQLEQEQDYIGFNWTPNATVQQSPSIVPRSVPMSSNQYPPWGVPGPIDASTYISTPPSSHGHVYGASHSLSGLTTNSSGSSTADVSIYDGGQPYFHILPPTSMIMHPHTNTEVVVPSFTRSPSLMTATIPTPMTINTAIPEAPARRQRPPSPRSQQMARYGTRNDDGTWSCHYDKCASQCRFRRLCDLRKHYLRHETRFYCSKADCSESEGNGSGFSSKKDCARHEQKHDPKIICEHPTCKKIFSRRDNMRDHVRRIHNRPKVKRRATTKD